MSDGLLIQPQSAAPVTLLPLNHHFRERQKFLQRNVIQQRWGGHGLGASLPARASLWVWLCNSNKEPGKHRVKAPALCSGGSQGSSALTHGGISCFAHPCRACTSGMMAQGTWRMSLRDQNTGLIRKYRLMSGGEVVGFRPPINCSEKDNHVFLCPW